MFQRLEVAQVQSETKILCFKLRYHINQYPPPNVYPHSNRLNTHVQLRSPPPCRSIGTDPTVSATSTGWFANHSMVPPTLFATCYVGYCLAAICSVCYNPSTSTTIFSVFGRVLHICRTIVLSPIQIIERPLPAPGCVQPIPRVLGSPRTGKGTQGIAMRFNYTEWGRSRYGTVWQTQSISRTTSPSLGEYSSPDLGATRRQSTRILFINFYLPAGPLLLPQHHRGLVINRCEYLHVKGLWSNQRYKLSSFHRIDVVARNLTEATVNSFVLPPPSTIAYLPLWVW